jgi:hypothetical protein
MTQEHAIAPPPERLKFWEDQHFNEGENYDVMLVQAYQAGADHELEACCEWMGDSPVIWRGDPEEHPGFYLREARRPKPPSLKEQALAVLDHTQKGYGLAEVDLDTIRRALEALPD